MSAVYNPTISVITPVKNAGVAFEECLESVRNQTYPHIEHIIIDGGSTDGSVALIEQHQGSLAYWHSKPDGGIADAFNQGIQQAKGDYLYFLGASDALYDSGTMAALLAGIPFSSDKAWHPWLICGRVCRTDEHSNEPLWVAPKTMPKRYSKWGLLKCLTLPHQGLLMHRAYFDRYGLFDTTLRYAMDYELILRSFHQFPTVLWKDVVVATWRAGGIGTNQLHKVWDEYHQIKCRHRIAPLPVLKGIDKLIRLKHWINT